MDKIRAFIAIELPLEIKSVLGELQSRLGADAAATVKWVRPESMHLTLRFLGDIDTSNVAQITSAMKTSCENLHSFNLKLADTGAFPNTKSPRVIWVGLQGDMEKLGLLHHNLQRTLSKMGFKPDNRAFSPHLTLGRIRNGIKKQERMAVGRKLSMMKVDTHPPFAVDQINLMRSDLLQSGAVYSKLSVATLKAACQSKKVDV